MLRPRSDLLVTCPCKERLRHIVAVARIELAEDRHHKIARAGQQPAKIRGECLLAKIGPNRVCANEVRRRAALH
jgi:hypothetical protein